MAKKKQYKPERWVNVFRCKFCGAAVRLEASLFKPTETHECNAATVGILEQIGAELAPPEGDRP